MAHIFNTSQYCEFRSKIYSSIKKTLELKIQQAGQLLNNDLHPCDGIDDIIIDGTHFNFVYEDVTMQLPLKLIDVKDFNTMFNMENIMQAMSSEQISELYKYLPQNQKNQRGLKYVFQGNKYTQKQLSKSPLQDFERKLKKGYFTILRQKQDQINKKLNQDYLYKYYTNLFNDIKNKKQIKSKSIQKIIFKDQDSLLQSLQQLNVQQNNSFDSSATQTQQQIVHQLEEQYQNKVYFKYDYNKIKSQEELIAMGEDRNDKKTGIIKTTIMVRPRNNQWVQSYRKQQLLRYTNPTKPWVYLCQDNRKVTVAPVAKKMSVLTGKPRDHPMLKIQRPACVTILTLVRDAAARLPNGVGTRADICQLLKQSQFVNEDLAEQKLSSIVSGALDRLHYMADACVKYDSQKKLWIYLHTDRNHQHPGWGQDGQQYIQKKSYKKRKNDAQ